MLIGYTRVSKADGSQTLEDQLQALTEAGVEQEHIYSDQACAKGDQRPALEGCLKVMRKGDVLLVWKLDRLGRDLTHLVNLVNKLHKRGIGLAVLTGLGAEIDTNSPSGNLIFAIFAALAEFDREQISERKMAGLTAIRSRGERSRNRYSMTPAKLRLAIEAMTRKDTIVSDLSDELGVTSQTLYRYVGRSGELRGAGEVLLRPRKSRQLKSI